MIYSSFASTATNYQPDPFLGGSWQFALYNDFKMLIFFFRNKRTVGMNICCCFMDEICHLIVSKRHKKKWIQDFQLENSIKCYMLVLLVLWLVTWKIMSNAIFYTWETRFPRIKKERKEENHPFWHCNAKQSIDRYTFVASFSYLHNHHATTWKLIQKFKKSPYSILWNEDKVWMIAKFAILVDE